MIVTVSKEISIVGPKNIIAIIPARSGSKGVKHKNIQKIADKPLLAYTIESALRSKKVDKVVVSTDDMKIAEVAKSFGAEVPFLRPIELSKDTTPSLSVIQHAVKHIEVVGLQTFDVVVLLQATSPLRTEKYIDDSIEKLLKTGADSVITVSEVKHHPFLTFATKGDKLYPFSEGGLCTTRRQDLPKVYAPNGAVYAIKRDLLFNQNSIFGKDTRAIIMPHNESVDIDDYYELFVAEMTIKYWDRWMRNRK